MITQLPERPPFIEFEARAIEDRAKTIDAGVASYSDVDFVKVTPLGGNGTLVLEREVQGWLNEHRKKGSPLLAYFEESYRNWKQNQSTPERGTPVRMWPAASPSEVQQLLGGGCRTIEDLAGWPDGNLSKLGMGAVALKRRAQAYLAAAENNGKISEKAAALEARNKDLEETVKAQGEQLAALTAQVQALGRKNKAA